MFPLWHVGGLKFIPSILTRKTLNKLKISNSTLHSSLAGCRLMPALWRHLVVCHKAKLLTIWFGHCAPYHGPK
jgi:hypothetical protein